MPVDFILDLEYWEKEALEEINTAIEDFTKWISDNINFYLDVSMILNDKEKIIDIHSCLKVVYELFRLKGNDRENYESFLKAVDNLLELIRYGVEEENFIREVLQFLFIVEIEKREKFISLLDERLQRKLIYIFPEEN